MIALELMPVLVVAGLVVGTQFRVFAMAPLAFAACACALFEALTVGVSTAGIALYVAETAVFFEIAYGLGAALVSIARPALSARIHR